MINPEIKDIGRAVIYVGNRYEGGKPEPGIITSISLHFVFVLYGADRFSKATLRGDLEWSSVHD